MLKCPGLAASLLLLEVAADPGLAASLLLLEERHNRGRHDWGPGLAASLLLLEAEITTRGPTEKVRVWLRRFFC